MVVCWINKVTRAQAQATARTLTFTSTHTHTHEWEHSHQHTEICMTCCFSTAMVSWTLLCITLHVHCLSCDISQHRLKGVFYHDFTQHTSVATTGYPTTDKCVRVIHAWKCIARRKTLKDKRRRVNCVACNITRIKHRFQFMGPSQNTA